MPWLGDVEYIPDANGIAEYVKCPLVEDWIDPIDCMETANLNPKFIEDRFKVKPDWKQICDKCPFRDY